MAWDNRIVGHGEEAPDQLLANPNNWRIHPRSQQEALTGLLSQVGWVQDVIVNKRTGHIVDGHLRVELALTREETTIPVVYVDLSVEEEALVLASLDPLAALAVTDHQMLAELIEGLTIESPDLDAMLAAAADPGTRTGQFTASTPSQEDIDKRAREIEEAFQKKQLEMLAQLINLVCPECGAEFSASAQEILSGAAARNVE